MKRAFFKLQKKNHWIRATSRPDPSLLKAKKKAKEKRIFRRRKQQKLPIDP